MAMRALIKELVMIPPCYLVMLRHYLVILYQVSMYQYARLPPNCILVIPSYTNAN